MDIATCTPLLLLLPRRCMLSVMTAAAAAVAAAHCLCSHLDKHQLIDRQHSTQLLCMIIAAAAVTAARERKPYCKQQQITHCHCVL
jgi:hypothetical protein